MLYISCIKIRLKVPLWNCALGLLCPVISLVDGDWEVAKFKGEGIDCYIYWHLQVLSTEKKSSSKTINQYQLFAKHR